ncbi:hypothetical protein ACFRAQ_35060 [Nocardia sp. NPDC056611]|uniref:hypothetical protein n=1 Tax=Nocardia sp. NPDC056611 TaxID=3345877 RepID=UPI00366FC0EB
MPSEQNPSEVVTEVVTPEPDKVPDAPKTPEGGESGAKVNEFGFPDETPLAEMTTEQQLAYWKHKSRKHEDAAKGKSPAAEVQKLNDRIAELEREKLSDDQRVQADAIEAAKAEAAQKAREELLPQLREAQLRGYASIVLTDQKKLDRWLGTTNAGAFLGEDGELDGSKVVEYLRDMYGVAEEKEKTPPPNGQRHPNWGQGQGGGTQLKRGDHGRSEAARRYGKPKE